MKNDKLPIVSICCITYNHAPFIRKALDGFLMQEPLSCIPQDSKLSDWCEILIHDDCSTDGTDDIIREYAAKYPDVIYPLYEEINQYTIGGKGRMDLYNYNRARGRYIAYCEGDDCWTDSLKLRKQVEFMDLHTDYSICWHRVVIVDANEDYLRPGNADVLFANLPDSLGVDIDIPTFFSDWFTQPCSMLIRRNFLDVSWRELYNNYCDTHEIYHLLKIGKGHILNFIGANYHVHQGGVASSMNEIQSCLSELGYIDELYKANLDQYTKEYWRSVLLWTINTLEKHNKKKRICLVLLHEFKLFGFDTMKIIYTLFKRKIKRTIKQNKL